MNMGREGCVNGKLDDANYSSPMPVIGLYVAPATLVCLLLILIDIFAGFHNKKRWIPCRFFSLNSITLTLLSIASKLPMDLTTPMPSTQDQLSKLTGTTLICTCMGFLMPSLGTTKDSECFSNMVAMSILVFTVFVNICIQMHTGVIFLFSGEHIAILCFMMLLLAELWVFAPIINTQKEISTDYIREYFTHGKGSLFQRLKLCYLYSYNWNPQLVLCKKLICPSACFFCLLCSGILVRAMFQSLVFKKCQLGGVSDYKWSMLIIVVSQMITILVGCLGTIFRLVSMAEHVQEDDVRYWCESEIEGDSLLQNPRVVTLMCPFFTLVSIIEVSIIALYAFVATLARGGCSIIDCKSEGKDDDEEAMKEFKDLIDKGEMGLDEWTLKRGAKDMKRWIVLNKPKPSNDLIKLLSNIPPSQDQYNSLTSLLKNQCDPNRQGYERSLSIVVLARIARVVTPSSLNGSLFNSLGQVLEIIHYIERKMCPSSFRNKRKYMISKALWDGTIDLSIFRSKLSENGSRTAQSNQLSDEAIAVIGHLKEELRCLSDHFVKLEVEMIIDFIEQETYGSIEELYRRLERLFVDMLNEFLIQLPESILKEIVESHPEDLEERVKYALKVVCKIVQFEALVPWSFPIGTGITKLIEDEEDRAETDQNNNVTFETNGNAPDDQSIGGVIQEEIIQVE